jgi:Raf kinase inhibitor-like YbhB/YbcL family protein
MGRRVRGRGGSIVAMMLRSDAFESGRAIPRRYTEDGVDDSPHLTWSGLPEGTKELALIIDDPDAPQAEPWVHWVFYKIPDEVQTLTEGLPPTPSPDAPPGSMQGKNSWGTDGYRGPAPPKGHGTHHDRFRLDALDAPAGRSSRGRRPADGAVIRIGALRGRGPANPPRGH